MSSMPLSDVERGTSDWKELDSHPQHDRVHHLQPHRVVGAERFDVRRHVLLDKLLRLFRA